MDRMKRVAKLVRLPASASAIRPVGRAYVLDGGRTSAAALGVARHQLRTVLGMRDFERLNRWIVRRLEYSVGDWMTVMGAFELLRGSQSALPLPFEPELNADIGSVLRKEIDEPRWSVLFDIQGERALSTWDARMTAESGHSPLFPIYEAHKRDAFLRIWSLVIRIGGADSPSRIAEWAERTWAEVGQTVKIEPPVGGRRA